MRIKFDQLDYQDEAVNSAVNTLEGQQIRKSEFTIVESGPMSIGDTQTTLIPENQTELFGETQSIGVGNRIIIDDERLLQNINKVQIKNGIAPSEELYGNNNAFPQFNIEMETGTGKTFVYLKSILKMHQKYGFTKFAIIVPSIAIKAGTIKNLEMTKEFFKREFNGVIYNYFEYDSNNLGRVREYSQSSNIDIMVINIQAFRSEAGSKTDNKGNRNIIYRESDQIGGNRPIDLISSTNPIIIIDEPQSVDNTPLSKQAINNLRPSLGFRYSATHRDTSYPTLYRLGAVEAYDQELVKQIEVASVTADDDGNEAYMRLISVDHKKNITAKMEVYQETKGKISKKILTFRKGDDMQKKTRLPAYQKIGFINDIDATPGQEAVYFSGEPSYITLNAAIQEDLDIKRIQIHNTIKAHLDKELLLNPKGIKVLSLFFIDQVDKYRQYDEDGNELLGEYAQIFEDEYNKLIAQPRYRSLHQTNVGTNEVHDGYFSVDNKNRVKDTRGGTIADETTYEIIMKDKEGLLTFYDEERGNISRANKIRFIFSHSALKEGWDNPNVFQIATLVETQDTITKRQKIGRGLRIAVDQKGERTSGFDINTLTVMANESYEEFADSLQSEYEEDGIRFGIFEEETFATIIVEKDNLTEDIKVFGKTKSKKLVKELKENDYVNSNNRATDKLRQAIKDEELILSEEFAPYEKQIIEIANTKIKDLNIKDASKKTDITLNENALKSQEFEELWNRIKYKTNYKVHIDTDQLIQNIIHGTNEFEGMIDIEVRGRSYQYTSGKLDISDAGFRVDDKTITTDSGYLRSSNYVLPDIITHLQNETKITRKSIVEILTQSGNLGKFKQNPISYMMQAAKIINQHKENMIVDNIEYYKTGEEFNDLIFRDTSQGSTYVDESSTDYKVINNSDKTIVDFIRTDSNVERDFAQELDQSRSIKFYVKLPDKFTIDTPIGGYNPDWAIVKEVDGENRIYFIAETKGSTNRMSLRVTERQKINAGEKHFDSLQTGIDYEVVTKLDDLH
ncbi:MAG TPA: restriction endonuclease subunit R [Aerococcaceae bacterium]|uniref:restriction endonuclease n=3 Tax=Bacillota TaxID=1239 RepID=UPI000ED63805|nr:restriction endonuclease subunit R [Aerococcaceae bacterium]